MVVYILAGDYNGDDVVDAADYTVWRNNLNSNEQLPNDMTPGSVTADDYDVWKKNFGEVWPARAAGSGSASRTRADTLILSAPRHCSLSRAPFAGPFVVKLVRLSAFADRIGHEQSGRNGRIRRFSPRSRVRLPAAACDTMRRASGSAA